MSTGIALLLLAAGSLASGNGWYRSYDEGRAAMGRNEPARAITLFHAALAERAEEGLQVHAYGSRYLDYLPHAWLALAHARLGERDAARRELALAEAGPAAGRSSEGRKLLDAVHAALGRGAAALAPAPRPGPAPGAISDQEFDRLVGQVGSRCGIPGTRSSSDAPWYFHYELAEELGRAGDPRREIAALERATQQRPHSARGARMYGLWFKDYLPYLRLARAHARLGEWECALDALESSRRNGEAAPGAPEALEAERIESECLAQVGAR